MVSYERRSEKTDLRKMQVLPRNTLGKQQRERTDSKQGQKSQDTAESNNWVQEPLTNTMKLESRILPVKGSEFLDQPPNFHLQPIWSLRFMKWIL